MIEVGECVEFAAEGDKVAFWSTGCGAHAKRVCVRADRTVSMPIGMSPEVATALLVQGLTAHYLATSTFPIASDHVAVVHAAAGGVGLLLTQIVKIRGGVVLGTASSPEKRSEIIRNGADRAANYEEFVESVKTLTDGVGANVVHDGVGAATFDASLTALQPRGLMVLYGSTSGPVAPFDLLRLYSSGSLFVTHPTLTHYIATRTELLRRWQDLLDWVESGDVKVQIGGTYQVPDAPEAHRALESSSTVGKLVLLPNGN